MKYIRLLLALVLLLPFQVFGQKMPATPWIAYDMNGKYSVDTHDFIAAWKVGVVLPNTAKRNTRSTAFVTTTTDAPTGDLTGKTLSTQLYLSGQSPVFYNYTYQGLQAPVAVRLFFTSDPNPYNFGRIDWRSEGNYWFSTARVTMLDLLMYGFSGALLQSSLGDGYQWTSAWGRVGQGNTAFYDAAANVQQIGVAFGSYFYDTGVILTSGSATFYIATFDAN